MRLLRSPWLLPIFLVLGSGLVAACNTKGGDIGIDPALGGALVDADGDGEYDLADGNGDGTPDGWAVDTNGDGVADVVGLDTNGDGIIDGLDTNGDGTADVGGNPSTGGASGSGGSSTGGGQGTTGGTTGVGASPGAGGTVDCTAPTLSPLGSGVFGATGSGTGQYIKKDVTRDCGNYKFIANGWGPNWGSHKMSWLGTSFTVETFSGSQGAGYEPAGYPSMYCGAYSDGVSKECGLPAAVSGISKVSTGWRWKANGNSGQYNAAWDVWLGSGTSVSTHNAYLMVWLREPGGQQPAGSQQPGSVTVPGLPGSWNVWTGSVGGKPIVNYVKPEGQDLAELEFDVKQVLSHAQSTYSLPGTHILSVAIGFEIWNGPVTNLVSEDFYVDVE